MCSERFQVGDAGSAQPDREKLSRPRLGHMDERPPVAALAVEAPTLLEAGETEIPEEAAH